jgi:ATP-dependent helicase/nuclease subunit A
VSPGSGLLPDAEARRRVAEDLDHSLVVVAGAGTGKTTALVSRVVALVRRGEPIRELAVITFTEAAAAELRTRVAEALAEAARREPDNPALATAVAEMDEAAICTLHAFAQRILVEHALAAGLPPSFDVLDELSERADLEARLLRLTDQLLDDPGAETMLLRGFVLGLGYPVMLEVAWCLHNHWDRLEDGALARIEAARPPTGSWPALDVVPVVEALERVLALAPLCTEPDDHLAKHLDERIRDALEVLGGGGDDEQAALVYLTRSSGFSSARGQADNWQQRAAEVRQACADAETARKVLLAEASVPVVAEMLARLARFTLEAAAARVAEGRLTFHDLLVHARRLLRDDEGARAALRRRYRWLLVDEFQDTDPLQVDLAAWLASAVEGAGDLTRARPGALFVVGDPKQSIYRFRRADIALYEEVSAAVGDEVVLTANFRSVPGVVRFVNALFPSLFGDPPDPGQAVYHPLAAQRPALPAKPGMSAVQLSLAGIGEPAPDPEELAPSPVVVVGGPVEGSVGEVRRAAASDLAAAVRRVVAEGWPVSDPLRPGSPTRAARWRDIALLIPTRTSLPALEEAFDEAGIPYRLEGAALLWGSDEVRDVLSALAAADEPSDAVSVLAALRSPGLGCGDDDLVDWRARGGSWDPRAEMPEDSGRHPVARAMAVLADLHRRRWWSEPSELVAAAVDAMRGHALAFAHRRPRQVWHRLNWIVDQARLFDETAAGSLHDFLRWAQLQSEGDGRTPSLGPPEADDDAVRVMTVHGAKGLEFPVVVLAGLERDDSAQRTDAVLWGDGDGVPEASFGWQLRSSGYESAAGADKELDRLERVRLLYVAMTRARDHLVLGVHHKVRNGTADHSQAAVLEELCRAHPLLCRRLPDIDVEPALVGAAGASTNGRNGAHPLSGGEEEVLAARRWATELWEWSDRRAEAIAGGRALPVVTASGLSHEPDGDTGAFERDAETALEAELQPLDGARRSGEVGLDIGRAVHGTLAAIDLRTGLDARGENAEAVARQRAQLHGAAGHADEVVRMVSAALSSPVVRWAAGRCHHRECYLAMPLGSAENPAVFEGFADLLVEGDEGLVIVDYKTDRIADDEALDVLCERYALQMASYAVAAETATGRPAVRAVLVFLSGAEPTERVIEGEALEGARAAARAAMGGLAATL